MTEQRSSSVWLRHEDGRRTEVQGTCTIGRSSTNHLALPDRKVSRRHAIVHAQDTNEFWLVDLGSSNGSFLNGRRVTHPVRLHDQDLIQIAQFTLLFQQPSAGDRDSTHETTMDQTVQHIEHAEAWLLVADIHGSTLLNRHESPEKVSVQIGSWFAQCKESIEKQEGNLDKYLGDGFLAYWTEGRGLEQNVACTLKALKGFQESPTPTLPFRLAVHYGTICFGNLPTMGEARLFGPEVNFAFRMERLAKELNQSRLMSESAFLRLGKSLDGQCLGPHELSGFDGAYSFYAF